MTNKSWLGIEDVPFVGGCICLNFTNTTGNRHTDEPRERLTDLHNWKVYLGRAEVFSSDELKKFTAPESQFSETTLPRLIELRECLFRLFSSSLHGSQPFEADCALFNKLAKQAREAQHLTWVEGTPHWQWHSDVVDSDAAMLRIVESAIKLLASDDLKYLKQCGDCDWLFLDISKNQSRRWCRKTCGDRVKARRYYSNKQKETE